MDLCTNNLQAAQQAFANIHPIPAEPPTTTPTTTFPSFRDFPQELQLLIWKAAATNLPTIHVSQFDLDLGSSSGGGGEGDGDGAVQVSKAVLVPVHNPLAGTSSHFVNTGLTDIAHRAIASRPHRALLSACRSARRTTIQVLGGPLLGLVRPGLVSKPPVAGAEVEGVQQSLNIPGPVLQMRVMGREARAEWHSGWESRTMRVPARVTLVHDSTRCENHVRRVVAERAQRGWLMLNSRQIWEISLALPVSALILPGDRNHDIGISS
ncbi:unnamed protein product [Discula destructiva]